VGGEVILFDAGDGVMHGLAAAGISLEQVRAVVLSHLHPDHTGGLAALVALRWQTNIHAPMMVYGPVGTAELVSGILASNRPAERVGFAAPGAILPSADASISAHELPCMGETTTVAGVPVTAVRNSHYTYPDGKEPANAASCSFRAVAAGEAIVYTGDTGPSDAVTRLAEQADLLVSEVIDISATMQSVGKISQPMSPEAREGMMFHLTRHHLTPADVGRMASAAGVKAVVLTHLSPGMDDERDTSGYVDGVRKLYRGPVRAASDGDRFPLPTSRSR
jgi:ribonuclease BN (tRNA processing enzyme)